MRYDNLFRARSPTRWAGTAGPTDGGSTRPGGCTRSSTPPLLRSATVRKFLVGMSSAPSRSATSRPEQAALPRASAAAPYRMPRLPIREALGHDRRAARGPDRGRARPATTGRVIGHSMDELTRRLALARKAFGTLQQILGEPKTAIVRDAAIQRFEYSFEAVWKAAQRFLREREGVEAASPKAVVRASFWPACSTRPLHVGPWTWWTTETSRSIPTTSRWPRRSIRGLPPTRRSSEPG